jgi:hypothetical protein
MVNNPLSLWIVGSSPTMTNRRAIFFLHGAAGKRHERLLRFARNDDEQNIPLNFLASFVWGRKFGVSHALMQEKKLQMR